MDANKTAGEEARRQLHKNAACNLKQVLAATPHKTPTVRSPPPYHENIQVRRTRHAGHCWRSRDELIRLPHVAVQRQDDQHEHTFSRYVRIQEVVLKTYLGRWTIGRSGERGSGISVLPARHDDDIYCLVDKVVANGPGDLGSILSNIWYGWMLKSNNSGKGVAPSPTPCYIDR